MIRPLLLARTVGRPLVIDSLRRHTNLTADNEQLFFRLTADLGGIPPRMMAAVRWMTSGSRLAALASPCHSWM